MPGDPGHSACHGGWFRDKHVNIIWANGSDARLPSTLAEALLLLLKSEDVSEEDVPLEWPGQYLPSCRESLPGNGTEEGST